MDNEFIKVLEPNEKHIVEMRLAEIFMDVRIKMYERTYPKNRNKNNSEFIPEWFKSYAKITNEAIETLEPEVLGTMIRDMYFELKYKVKQYVENKC